MTEINWNEIADKIRDKKFSEISDDIWQQIANKIEPKKRGRKPKKSLEYSDNWSLEDLHATENLHASIVAKYYRLLSSGVKSKKAFELIADNSAAEGNTTQDETKLYMTAGNVERIVYAWLKMEKELNEMIQDEMRLEKI